jgi:putative SOS response-associated peptidase YedK
MCGRFTVATDPAVLAERFEVELPEDWAPSYNVAPTDEVLGIVRARDAPRELRGLRFGLVPHWAKDIKAGFSMINARAETVRSKGAYRALLERRRALIVADGFYEWRTDPDGRKRPVHYTLASGEPFAFAGLWASWRDPQAGTWLDSCTIITTTANGLVAPVHDRMPVILPRSAEAAWLDPELDPAAVDSLLVPYAAEEMHAAEASMLVNSVKNDGPELLDPLA